MIAAFDYRFARFSRELDLRAAFLHALARQHLHQGSLTPS